MKDLSKKIVILTMLSLPLSQTGVTVFGVPLYLPEVLILVGMVAFIFGFRAAEIKWRPIPALVSVALSAFIVGSFVSSVSSGFSHAELGALKSWIVFPAIFGTLLFQVVQSDSERRRVLLFWYLGIVAAAAISMAPLPFVHVTYDGRLASYFPSPNHLALFLEAGVPIGSFFLLERLRAGRDGLFALVSVSLLLIVVVILRTGSLGALIAVLIGSVVLIASSLRLKRGAVITLATLCFLTILVPAVFVGSSWRVLETGQVRSSTASRVMIWNVSVRLLSDHPILGIGLRNFEQAYLDMQPQFPVYLEWAVPHPQNLILSVWLSMGAIGFAGFILMLLYLAERSSFFAFDPQSRASGTAGVTLALLVTFFVHGLVDTPFFRNDLSLAFFAVYGLILSLSNLGPYEGGRSDT
ncbi:MAG: O-antigen ligase family protein [Candidatus Moranbacteria bacterium]|nr:O-antigen ligase family protein [Candidatus Moranbacteria bacterium]